MSLWGRNVERVQTGTVYGITTVKVEDWPKESTHRHIQLIRDSSIIARGELAEAFVDISVSDAIIGGTLVGFEDLMLYRSCLVCKRRQSGDTCVPCQSPLLLNDFKVSISFGLVSY